MSSRVAEGRRASGLVNALENARVRLPSSRVAPVPELEASDVRITGRECVSKIGRRPSAWARRRSAMADASSCCIAGMTAGGRGWKAMMAEAVASREDRTRARRGTACAAKERRPQRVTR